MQRNNIFKKQIALAGLSILLLLPMRMKSQNNLIPGTQDCSGMRPPFAFTIQNAWNSNTSKDINTLQSVFAGDIDGDGVVEILCMNMAATSIYIFDGRTGAIAGTIPLGGIVSGSGYWDPMLICDCNRNGKGEIFVVGHNSNPIVRLYEVSSAPGVRPITFNTLWSHSYQTIISSPASYQLSMPIVADLDGDGIPEFVAGNHIISSQTGLSLATMALSGAGTYMSFPLAVDLDHDGLPEIVVGTNVYKYSAGVATLWRTCPGLAQQEGVNMAGDINDDGEIDLVFVSRSQLVKAWTPNTNQDLGTITSTVGGSPSYPFVGDIDGIVEPNGKKYLEVIVNTAGSLKAYSYTGAGFVPKWTMSHSDMSGSTAMTLFDFNNDGVMEIVYRDQTFLHIFNGAGSVPVLATPSLPCGSGTGTECPIVVDVNGDGSADIVVIGDPAGVNSAIGGEVMVFEGASSKWMSCPKVWNQQLYSNLYVNEDLTIPDTIKPLNLTYIQTCSGGDTVRYYNGGPMQAPYISENTYCPIDLSPDVYIVGGSITLLSPSSVEITITVGNQGLAVAPSSTPIRYYENSIATGNILSAASTTLGVDLYSGQTTIITRTISGLSPMPTKFYVRLLDDGTNFPAVGAFSDCNLTNNTKSFGTFELFKTANALSSCIGGTTVFTLALVNNSDQLLQPTTYTDIVITDSLGSGWEFISATPMPAGTVTAYNPTTHSMDWNIPSLAPYDTAQLIVVVKSQTSGALRNMSWVDSVEGVAIGKDMIEAYVIVSVDSASSPLVISPADTTLCAGAGSLILTATGASGAVSYQWYKDNIEIVGATLSTYTATTAGNYSVSYFDGNCLSQRSNEATITISSTPVPAPVVSNLNLSYWQYSTAPSLLSATGATPDAGYTLQWYLSDTTTPYSDANNPMNTDTAGVKTYFVSQINDTTGCESAKIPVYAMIVKPQAFNYIACPGATVILEVEAMAGVDFYWYAVSSGGTPSPATPADTHVVVNVSPPLTFWVEPRMGATVYERIPITISVSLSCGGTPVECATSGTLLFREDFGGNNPSDPDIKPTGIPQVSPVYLYVTTSAGIYNSPTYSINKYSLSHSAWYRVDDHTYPSDTTRGYMLQVNAAEEAGQFYEYQIDGLCSGTRLYFSAWMTSILALGTLQDKTNQIFILEDTTGAIIAQYHTGDLPDVNPAWKQYGFEFIVPAGLTSLILRIINNSTGSAGNDFVLDDIEIRLCLPPITITVPSVSDTTICAGASITLNASYTDDGTFGSPLTYRWEHNPTGNFNDPNAWTTLITSTGTSPLNVTYPIASMTNADTGYYRLLAGTSLSIDQANCRATSAPVRLGIIPTDTLSANISASDNNVCVGTSIIFTANVTNGGSPTYQWKINGTDVVGETASTFTYTPDNNDVVTCTVTSSLPCAAPTSMTTSGITMIIVPKAVPSITIKVRPN